MNIMNAQTCISEFANVLWHTPQHRENCVTFLHEIFSVKPDPRFDEFDNLYIEKIISKLKNKGNSNATINRKLAAFYKFLKLAERHGLITRLPAYVRLPEKNQRVRFLTPHEEEFLFQAISARDKNHSDLCHFLIDSGARVGEALATNHGDYMHGSVTFWVTKSGRSRTVPLTDRCLDIIERRKRIPRGPFANVNYQRFLYDWKAAKKACGLEKDANVVPHILRHTCASRLVQAGIDLRRVQAFLGHQTIQMTLRYAHLATNDLDQCAAALNRMHALNADQKTNSSET